MSHENDWVHELTVVLAEEEEPLRAGIRLALEADGLRVVAEAADRDGAFEAAIRHRPDVCLLATNLPGDGIAAARQIHEALPDVPIVMLTEIDGSDELFECLRAGSNGYLAKSISARRLPFAVRGVVAGEAALPRTLTASLIDEFRDRGRRHRLPVSVAGGPVELTAREFEVFERMRTGSGTAAIAAQLHISEVTVRRHISAVVHKLGVADRRSAVELVARAQALELAHQPDRTPAAGVSLQPAGPEGQAPRRV